jgi:Nif-specific regulatory protein
MSRFLQVLYELSRSFTELLDLDELIPAVIRKTKESLRADGSAVLLVDPATGELFFPYTAEAGPAVDRSLAGLRLPGHRGIAGSVLASGRAELVEDASKDARWFAAADQQTGVETRALLTAPLRTRRGIIGVIQVRSGRAGAFSTEDLEFLDSLARNIAIAIDNARLYHAVKTSEAGLRHQVALLHREVARSSRFSDIIGCAPAMERVFRLIEGAITAPVPVLLQGETGTGKELIARAIHYNGPRADKPFVAVNCAALSGDLLESELFGHRRGAFTGAIHDRKGFFEVADGGSILLDEVGDMSPAMQVKLLRTLQDGEIIPVGETAPRRVDVRLISATNSDLEGAIVQGRFRQDLYYRLSTFPIPVPPLRERREDIPLLAAHFLKAIGERFGKSVAGLSRAAMDAFVAYSWPGNVRELQNELQRAVVLVTAGEEITPAELSAHVCSRSNGAAVTAGPPAAQMAVALTAAPVADPAATATPLRQARAAFEAQYIEAVLRQQRGNVSATARVLGVSRGVLRDKLKEYGLR